MGFAQAITVLIHTLLRNKKEQQGVEISEVHGARRDSSDPLNYPQPSHPLKMLRAHDFELYPSAQK